MTSTTPHSFHRGDRVKLADRWHTVTRVAGDFVWTTWTGVAGQSTRRLASDLARLAVAVRPARKA
jgi:hypothetical protein